MSEPAPSCGLPGMLGAAFAAFEAIRRAARLYEDTSPDLFAAFMSAAAAAADGRDAILTADCAVPAAVPPAGVTPPPPGADPHQAADAIAASADVLASWLERAAALARSSQDRAACRDAAAAAARIRDLTAAADDAGAR